ncbi:UNVERIFIED_CONTAM: hypothetical protein H355_000948 [Colinus virginianus]|nr:hypothetical protein H355_000948 [Colinus virginianus]
MTPHLLAMFSGPLKERAESVFPYRRMNMSMDASHWDTPLSCFGYPLSIFFIVINEFCERFSYYGMRAVLVLYFKYFLRWDDNLSTAIYHTFVALCYLTPILGALIADSWLGKFKTIISLSIVYTIGQAVMAVSSINDMTDQNRDGSPDNIAVHVALSITGLILIALGTGGIKPCVSAFGGDQFEDHQFAIKNRFRHRSKEYPKREHWLDWASEKYDKRLIAQTKMVLKVLFLYIPLPMFWALFDQQTVNPILIVIMVPVVDAVIYPLIQKCKINFTPLRKMTVGMFLAGLAFIAAALLQVQIDKTLPVFPAAGQSQIKIINLGNSNADVTFLPDLQNVTVPPMGSTGYTMFETSQLKSVIINFGSENRSEIIDSTSSNTHTVTIKNAATGIVSSLQSDNFTSKPEEGKNLVRFVNNLPQIINVTMGDTHFGMLEETSISNYSPFSGGRTDDIVITTGSTNCTTTSEALGYGGAFTIVINQAPSNMKSVLQAGWLLTVAVGNIIVLIVAGASKLSEQWAEYVLFAALLFAVCIIFSVMAYFYTYIDPNEVEAQLDEEEKKKQIKQDLNSYEKESEAVSQM